MSIYEEDNRIFKVPTIHTFSATSYAIFRVGKKYKTMNEIIGFRKHMEREIETLNSNGNKNQLLIGDKELLYAETVLEKLKKRKNSVLARDMLFTASPSFFKNISEEKFYEWVDVNIKFLDNNFQSVVYANLHIDEKTPHIHALMIPINDKGNLCNSYYFDGRKKLKEWQDKYHKAINDVFPQVERGTPNSKATHEDIQKFYNLITKPITNDMEVLKAKAKYSELLEIKIKSTEKTLEAYKKQNERLKEDNKRISLELENTRHRASLWEKVSNYIALVYKVPQKRFNEIVDYIRNEKVR